MVRDSGSGLRSILDKTGTHNLLGDVEGKQMASPLWLRCSLQWSESNCARHWEGWCKVHGTSSDTLREVGFLWSCASITFIVIVLASGCYGYLVTGPHGLFVLATFCWIKIPNNIWVYLLLFCCFLSWIEWTILKTQVWPKIKTHYCFYF